MRTRASSDTRTVLALRLDVAHQIARAIARLALSQVAAARRLDIPQPTVSNIVNGRVSAVSLELLIRIAVRAGLQLTLQIGQIPAEAGAFVSGSRSRPGRARKSSLSEAASESVSGFEHRMTAAQRLEAFLEHNQLISQLHAAGRRAEATRRQQAGQR